MTLTPELLAAQQRWQDLEALQEHYTDFRDFYTDVIYALLGVKPTDIQYDIAAFLQYGPHYLMIQAQRGEAKTTITSAYAVWCLIHNPAFRILILSAGGKMAKQVSTGIIQIINTLPELECLRADRTAGDRASVEAYDVHHVLKGANKSPSIACLGVTSNMQGYRADLIIADDIESSKNALTEIMRENLRHLTRDFTSICSIGRIVYLGTPQSIDSIYNGLPSRGYTVRIWPGRYPTKEEEAHYGDCLAPIIRERMEADPSLRTGGGPIGKRGKPTDPLMMSEEMLTTKEIDQGPAYFDLQYMLNTELTDEERFPLKVKDLIFMSLAKDTAPGKVTWGASPDLLIPPPVGSNLSGPYHRQAWVSDQFYPYTTKLLSIDPAGGGQNADETGYAVLFMLHGYIFVLEAGGIKGGFTTDGYDFFAKKVLEYDISKVLIEQNYGNGAYMQAVKPVILKLLQKERPERPGCGFEEVWVSGQKELRIIDCLEPIIARHHLIFNDSILADDIRSTRKYPVERMQSYQLMFQIARITRDKDCLLHDDRLDAIANGVRYLLDRLAVDADKLMAQKRTDELQEFLKNPTGYRPPTGPAMMRPLGNIMNRFNRKR